MEKHRITVFCIEYNKTAGEGAAVLKSFPQPLTAAEEKYYVQKYTEGDLEAKHILIERNLRLVAHIVKKYQPPPEEMEDLLSIGTIGLMKAVVTFDPEKSVFPGAVICLHDGRGENGAPGRTIEALKKAIPMLKAQGYEFRRIEEKYETAGRSEIS